MTCNGESGTIRAEYRLAGDHVCFLIQSSLVSLIFIQPVHRLSVPELTSSAAFSVSLAAPFSYLNIRACSHFDVPAQLDLARSSTGWQMTGNSP